MFEGATNFNKPVEFNTENVVDISNMFKEATGFN